jgi:hypothetical protein
MSNAAFDTPVTILVGLGFPCKIRSAKAALAYLEDRPSCERDDAWEAVVVTCRDALAERTTADDARNVFSALARRQDILVENTMPHTNRDLGRRTRT